jgi:hypothetical protein
VEYSPVMCKLAFPSLRTLKPLQAGVEQGEDRYSEEVFISYGRYGFYFDTPGEYLIRALYQGAGDILIPSNVHRLRVGNPLTKEMDVLAQDYFSYEVGMNLYLDGSRSPYLEKGMNVLREISERYPESVLGAKMAMTVANSLTQPFFRIQEPRDVTVQGQNLKLVQEHEADPAQALDVTKSAVNVFLKTKRKSLNLAHHQLVSQRVECHMKLDQHNKARKELLQLHDHLSETGANPPVLDQVKTLAENIAGTRDAPGAERHRLWERVRVHDEFAIELVDAESSGHPARNLLLTSTAAAAAAPRKRFVGGAGGRKSAGRKAAAKKGGSKKKRS